MKLVLKVKVNGQLFEVPVAPNKTLLEFIREDLGLMGTKRGCDQGECGACTVLIDGKPVSSCMMLALDAQGKDIVTIEGMESEDGKLHTLQEAFVEHGAIQCGFCTSGMLLTAKHLLDENPSPSTEEIKEAISGNICRCTGYVKIIDAISAAAGVSGKSN
jgi:aerobic-type carbon monoxide dehydrogenase small subunit (CoxS/CutS family)